MAKKVKARRTAAKPVKPSAKVGRFVYWTPRIFSLIVVAFFLILSFDVFTPDASAGEMAVGFLIHNISTVILLAFVLIAWRHELVGAIVFGMLALFFIVQFAKNLAPTSWPPNEIVAAFVFIGSMLMASCLYFINWRRKRKK